MTTITVTSVTKDSPAAGQVTIVGTYSHATHSQPAQQTTMGEFPEANKNWSRSHRLTETVLMCIRNGAASVAMYLTSWAKIAITLEPTLTWPIRITAQPSNVSAFTANGSNYADYTVEIFDNEAGTSYQWQVSTNGGSSYSSISDGSVYSGATTSSLRVTPPNNTYNNYKYRCVCTNPRNSVTSNAVTLSVN